MYTAILLSPFSCDVIRSLEIPTRGECADCDEVLVTINERTYRCLAPSEEEMMFYDFLYSEDGMFVGLELRIFDDRVRRMFHGETQDLEYVTWDVYPRIWLCAERSGDPLASTAELFGDVFLCYAGNSQWAILVHMDGVLSRLTDLGLLR